MSSPAAGGIQVEQLLDDLIGRLNQADPSKDVRAALIEARRLRNVTARWSAIPPPADARREMLSKVMDLVAVARGDKAASYGHSTTLSGAHAAVRQALPSQPPPEGVAPMATAGQPITDTSTSEELAEALRMAEERRGAEVRSRLPPPPPAASPQRSLTPPSLRPLPPTRRAPAFDAELGSTQPAPAAEEGGNSPSHMPGRADWGLPPALEPIESMDDELMLDETPIAGIPAAMLDLASGRLPTPVPDPPRPMSSATPPRPPPSRPLPTRPPPPLKSQPPKPQPPKPPPPKPQRMPSAVPRPLSMAAPLAELDGSKPAPRKLRFRLAEGMSVVRPDAAQWRPYPNAVGVRVKLLQRDPDTGRYTALVQLEAQAFLPAHKHAGIEEMFVVSGDASVGDFEMQAGDYCRSEADTVHEPIRSPNGCTLLVLGSEHDTPVESASGDGP